jgi:hypothetical protein
VDRGIALVGGERCQRPNPHIQDRFDSVTEIGGKSSFTASSNLAEISSFKTSSSLTEMSSFTSAPVLAEISSFIASPKSGGDKLHQVK